MKRKQRTSLTSPIGGINFIVKWILSWKSRRDQNSQLVSTHFISSLGSINIFHMIRHSWLYAKQIQFMPYLSALVYTLLLIYETFLDVGVFFSENNKTSWDQRAHIWLLKISLIIRHSTPLPLNKCTVPAYARMKQICNPLDICLLWVLFQDNGCELLCPYSLAWEIPSVREV